MSNQVVTNKGVNLPPYFKGFPMNSALIFIGVVIGLFFLLLLISILIMPMIFAIGVTLIITGAVAYQLFFYIKKNGKLGLTKLYVKHFYLINKISGGRPKIHKI